ncbi:MAG: PDZ domain-containing protein [Pirellulales bacterium]|nr:PDZ domain-containing protein [Pirellulales bacterium]
MNESGRIRQLLRITPLVLLGLLPLTASNAEAEHDWPAEAEPALAQAGAFGCPCPLDLGLSGHVEWGLGLVVECVPPCTLAARLGLEPGDVIVRINGRRIRCEADYARGLAEAARCGVLRLVVVDVRTGGPLPIVYRLPGGRVRRRPSAPAFPGGPWGPGVGLPWGGAGGRGHLGDLPDPYGLGGAASFWGTVPLEGGDAGASWQDRRAWGGARHWPASEPGGDATDAGRGCLRGQPFLGRSLPHGWDLP